MFTARYKTVDFAGECRCRLASAAAVVFPIVGLRVGSSFEELCPGLVMLFRAAVIVDGG